MHISLDILGEYFAYFPLTGISGPWSNATTYSQGLEQWNKNHLHVCIIVLYIYIILYFRSMFQLILLDRYSEPAIPIYLFLQGCACLWANICIFSFLPNMDNDSMLISATDHDRCYSVARKCVEIQLLSWILIVLRTTALTIYLT